MADAVIIAGGTIPDSEADFREAVGVPCKSLIAMQGRVMVGHVIEALKGAERIDRIAVVGPPELQGHPDCAGADIVLEEAKGRSENLFMAVEALAGAERILMVTSDTPMITPRMVDDLLLRLAEEVELGYVVVAEETVLGKYSDRPPPPPDGRGRQMPNWVTISLREGRFTGTACFLFTPDAVARCRALIKGIFDNREMGNIIRTLRPLFGTCFLLRAALVFKFAWLGRLLSLSDIERALGRGLGVTARCYVSPYAELAFDVDHLTDVAIAERVLAERS